VREENIHDILKACHDGCCGGHFADMIIGHKVLKMGYFWPSVFSDARKYVHGCDSCQRMGQPTKSNQT